MRRSWSSIAGTGWTRPQIDGLPAAMGARPRDIIREKGTPAAELGRLAPQATDDQILQAMVLHPIRVNRPIVVTPKGVKLCRPSEVALELLDSRPAAFTKEDGGRGSSAPNLSAWPRISSVGVDPASSRG